MLDANGDWDRVTHHTGMSHKTPPGEEPKDPPHALHGTQRA